MTAAVEAPNPKQQLGQLELLDLASLQVSKFNPRQHVGDLTELATSIKEIGVVEPIVAVRRNGGYDIIAGSRRSAAAREAGLTQIPARILELDDAQAMAASLIENLQRKDLEPLEEAEAFAKYIALTGCTQKQLGERVGRGASTIANALRLLESPKPVRAALEKGDITPAHAMVALSLKDSALLSKLPLSKGVTVERLKMEVDQANRVYEREGAPAIAAAKKVFADAQAAYPGTVVTWGLDRYGYADNFMLKNLGKPPSRIQGRIRGETKPHDKVCKCVAWAVTRDPSAFDGAPKLTVERVCVDAMGWNKLQGRTKVTTRQGPTKEEREKNQRKSAMDSLKAERVGVRDLLPKSQAVYRQLASKPLQSEIGRVVLFAFICAKESFFAPTEQVYLWEAITKLPLTRVRSLLVEHALDRVYPHVYKNGIGATRQDKFLEPLLAYFKLTPDDIGIKPPEPKKKAAKKK